jgi:hypothetical protein
MDLKIDIGAGATNDLILVNGDLATVEDVEGDPAETTQRCYIALSTRLGEWLYDITLGLDYIGEIMIKNPNLPVINARLRTFLLTVEGVTGINRVVLDHNEDTRTLTGWVGIDTPFGPGIVPLP